MAALDKVGPRPYHFRSGPTSGPTTGPGSQKCKISMVHTLAVLKGYPECLKCGKTLWRPWTPPRTPLGKFTALPRPRSWWGCPSPTPRTPPCFRPPTLALRASLRASPNPFTKIRLCSERTYVHRRIGLLTEEPKN